MCRPHTPATPGAGLHLPLMTITAAEVFMNRTGVLLLGWIGSSRDAGIYALAFNIAFLTVLPQTAVNALLAPTVSDLFGRSDHEQLQTLRAATGFVNNSITSFRSIDQAAARRAGERLSRHPPPLEPAETQQAFVCHGGRATDHDEQPL